MPSDLAFCVSTIPLTSPRFPANHGPNADPLQPSTRDFDCRLPSTEHAGESGSASNDRREPLADRDLHVGEGDDGTRGAGRARPGAAAQGDSLRPWSWRGGDEQRRGQRDLRLVSRDSSSTRRTQPPGSTTHSATRDDATVISERSRPRFAVPPEGPTTPRIVSRRPGSGDGPPRSPSHDTGFSAGWNSTAPGPYFASTATRAASSATITPSSTTLS